MSVAHNPGSEVGVSAPEPTDKNFTSDAYNVYMTITTVTEPKSSTSLMSKPPIQHNTEPLPPTSHPHTLLP
jgi:hypothetical protein